MTKFFLYIKIYIKIYIKFSIYIYIYIIFQQPWVYQLSILLRGLNFNPHTSSENNVYLIIDILIFSRGLISEIENEFILFCFVEAPLFHIKL